MNNPEAILLAEKFIESLPAREAFPINRTETIELVAKFIVWRKKLGG